MVCYNELSSDFSLEIYSFKLSFFFDLLLKQQRQATSIVRSDFGNVLITSSRFFVCKSHKRGRK